MIFFVIENIKVEFRELLNDINDWIGRTLTWISGIPRNVYNSISSILYNMKIEIQIRFRQFLNFWTTARIFQATAIIVALPFVIMILLLVGKRVLELVEAFMHWLWEIFMSIFILIGMYSSFHFLNILIAILLLISLILLGGFLLIFGLIFCAIQVLNHRIRDPNFHARPLGFAKL
jgi:hypothetical protein